MFKNVPAGTIENLAAVAYAMRNMADIGTLPTVIESMSEHDYDCFVWQIAHTCELLGLDEYAIRTNSTLMQYIIRNETPKMPEPEPKLSENIPIYMRYTNPNTDECIYTEYNMAVGASRRRMIKDILACGDIHVVPRLSLEPFIEA